MQTIFEYTVVAHPVLSSSTQLQHYVLLCQLVLSIEKMLWSKQMFSPLRQAGPKAAVPYSIELDQFLLKLGGEAHPPTSGKQEKLV